MNKKYSFILIALLIFVIIINKLTVPDTKTKYIHKIDNNIVLKSTEFYFNNTASDLTISYDETAFFNFDITNYDYSGFTEKNINYTISWSNNVYGLNINDVEFKELNSTQKYTLVGGEKNINNIKIGFIPINDVPVEEKIGIKICSDRPYYKCEKFEVTVVSPDAFKVIGNPSEWTKEDVTLKIVPDVKNNQIEYCSFDNGNTWELAVYDENSDYVCSKTFDKNQLVPIKVKNFDGRTSDTINMEITKIDREAPIFKFENISQDIIDETLIVTLNESNIPFNKMECVDNKSGIESVTVTINDEPFENTNQLTEVGRYTIKYTANDNLGNQSIAYREVLVRWPLAGKYILARQNPIGSGAASETVGAGLYADDETTAKDSQLAYASKYYYSGKNVENYIKLPNTSYDKTADTTWRVINVAENDSVKIITNEVLNDTYTLSNTAINRWKVHKMAFFTSTIPGWISSGIVGDNEYNIDFSGTGYVDNAIFYIGAVDRRGTSASDSNIYLETIDERTNISAYDNDYSTEEALSLIAWQSKLGIISVTDITKSANSAKVFSIRSMQENQEDYGNTSWMYKNEVEWSLSACSSQSNQFWRLENKQFLSKLTSNIYKGAIRPVIYLKNDTILSGTGKEDDPFVVQKDWQWFDSQYPSNLYN